MKNKKLQPRLNVSDYNFIKGLLYKEMQEVVLFSEKEDISTKTKTLLKRKYYFCKNLIQTINAGIFDYYDI